MHVCLCICLYVFLSAELSTKIFLNTKAEEPLALAADLWADRLGALSRRMGNSHSALRVRDFLPCLDQPDKAKKKKKVGKGSGFPTLSQCPLLLQGSITNPTVFLHYSCFSLLYIWTFSLLSLSWPIVSLSHLLISVFSPQSLSTSPSSWKWAYFNPHFPLLKHI